MKTEQTVFNIIWLDDQIDDLYKIYKKELRDSQIKVLGKGAHDIDEFERQMQKYKYAVDAVVTDANFNIKVKDDFDGLMDVSYLIKKYNKERPIPFLVFSGRDNLVDTVNKRTLDQFDGRFEKQKGISPLIEAIKEFILKVNSKEFRIRNKYKDELAAASLIKGNEESLMNALLYDYAEDWEKTEDYFNPMRKIVEAIFDESKTLRIIPPTFTGSKLSPISKFLNNGVYENYSIIEGEELMPKPLARSLWYFLDITQDCSHKNGDLKLGVDKYVQDTKNVNLFRTVLYIAMDLCLWYKKVRDEADSPDYLPKWERVKNRKLNSETIYECSNEKEMLVNDENFAQVKSYYETKTFKPEKDEDGCWHCEECLVGIHAWKDDGSIILYDLTNNTTSSKDKYPYYARYKRVKDEL